MSFLYQVGQSITTLDTKNTFTIRRCFSGGMGEVYMAERKEDRKPYALKTIRKELIQNLDKRFRCLTLFKWEAHVWTALGKHKNIVQAHWFEWIPDYYPLIVMEYIEGGKTLRDWMREQGHFEVRTALRICVQIVTGLIHAKREMGKEMGFPFVHRDLKPENVLMTEEGIPKVSDFGLAKALGLGKEEGCGTPPYMAPEQWRNQDTDERTDIYAMGCVLYELLRGAPPFRGSNLERQHLDEKPTIPIVSASGEKIPEELRALIGKCLAKRKEERVESLEVLRDSLQSAYRNLAGRLLEVKDEPEDLAAEDWIKRGVAFSQLGFHQKALDCFDQAIGLDPNQAKFYLDRGMAHFHLDNLDAAIQNYQKALERNPRLEKAWVNIGHAYAKKGEYKLASESYEEAEKLKPQLAEIFLGKGNVFAHLGQYEQALSEYERAEKLGRVAEACLGRGNVYWLSGNLDKAEAQYLAAVEKNPFYVEAYESLAKFYHAIGKEKDAERYSQRARMISGL